MVDINFVTEWSARYPIDYDINYYNPYLTRARDGDIVALRRITEWKNVGKGLRPMPLSKTKELAFQFFLHNLNEYLHPNGWHILRDQFQWRAPVYSIFWHHVLFGTPIFDVYTNIAFHYDCSGNIITKKEAKIKVPSHWNLYDRYSEWFNNTLTCLRTRNPQVTERDLDRALFKWGEAHS
jgi:hypothetical protein